MLVAKSRPLAHEEARRRPFPKLRRPPGAAGAHGSAIEGAWCAVSRSDRTADESPCVPPRAPRVHPRGNTAREAVGDRSARAMIEATQHTKRGRPDIAGWGDRCRGGISPEHSHAARAGERTAFNPIASAPRWRHKCGADQPALHRARRRGRPSRRSFLYGGEGFGTF